jgi:hypothetical protein
MRPIAILALAAIVGSCAPADQPATEQDAAAPALTLAALAGTWTMQTVLDTPDSTVVDYTMSGGDDPGSWTITLPDRDPMPVRITVAGDSVVFDIGPFESVIRAGVMTVTRGVGRLSEGRMIGTLIVHYETTEPDSVVYARFEGSRTP